MKQFLLVGFIIVVLAVAAGFVQLPGAIYGDVVTGECVMESSDTCRVFGPLYKDRVYELEKATHNGVDYDPPPIGSYNACRVSGHPGIPCSVIVDDRIISYRKQVGGQWNTYTVNLKGDVEVGAAYGDSSTRPVIELYNEQPVDPCDGVTCQPSVATCPDGYIAYCSTYCIPETGLCSTCVPDCTGHEEPAIPEPANIFEALIAWLQWIANDVGKTCQQSWQWFFSFEWLR